MTLQASGQIKFSDIQSEFGGVIPISLSEYYISGSLVPQNNISVPNAGLIRFTHFYNTTKSYIFNKIISSNTVNYNVRDDAIANGWDTITPLVANITINESISVTSASSGSPAFDSGNLSSNSTINLVNNGSILGKSGNGGAGAVAGGVGGNGGIGGVALKSLHTLNLTNNGIIGGGNGGNGGNGSSRSTACTSTSYCSGSIQCSTQFTRCTSVACSYISGTGGTAGSNSTGSNGSNGITPGGNSYTYPACPAQCSITIPLTGSCSSGTSGGLGGSGGLAISGISFCNILINGSILGLTA